MSNTPVTPVPTDPNAPSGDPQATPVEPAATPTFSQADVDRIIGERLVQQAKNKFGDYDELKAKAGESLTLEQRVEEMELRTKNAEADAMRSRVAAQFGVSTAKGPKGEPSDADLFLTGSDEATLTAQAERLGVREADRKKQGNLAPKEGTSPSNSGTSDDLRDFTKKLFNKE